MRVFMFLCLLFAAPALQAHPAATSVWLLQINDDSLSSQLELPIDQLQMANPQWSEIDAENIVADFQALIFDYVKQHIAIHSSDNQALTFNLNSLKMQTIDDQHYAVMSLWLNLPTEISVDELIIDYDVIMHRVRNHQAMVTINTDFSQAIFPDSPKLLTTLRYKKGQFQLGRDQASVWHGFVALFKLGMLHIAEGSDHLLFLLCLLLPAPLIAKRGQQWQRTKLSVCFFYVLKIISAFSLGHSVTLALGAFSILVLPTQPIEVLVALSIIVASFGVVRPEFSRHSMLIAGSFGLIHGMAFSATLSNMNLDNTQLAVALLGFNLGIEALQLLVVLLTIPVFYILSKQIMYRGFCLVSGAFASLAALEWGLNRAFNWFSPLSESLAGFIYYACAIYISLLVIAMISLILGHRPPDKMSFVAKQLSLKNS